MERRKRRKYNRKSSNTHISLTVIKQYLLYGVYPSGSTPSDKRSVRKRSQSFKIENRELYYVVRPKHIEGEPPDPNPRENKQNLRKAVLSVKDQLSVASAVHVQGNGGNHMGTERTLSSLSSKYYWVGMAATVRKVIKSCVVCLASRPAVSFLPPHPQSGATLPQTWDPGASYLVPKSKAVIEKTEVFIPKEITANAEVKCSVLSEGDGQFVLTNELTEPEEGDSDLDLIPEAAVPDGIFDAKTDYHEARRFWHKVEFQILGPFQHRKNRLFVVAAMDSFSKWPEVQTLENFDERTVSQFCLKLIARYGVMEHLILLENDVSSKKPLDASGVGQNLQSCFVNVSKEDSDPLDENWHNLSISIQRFVSVYTEDWPYCLELCLLPLRNTVNQRTEFTPAFLLMGVEPVFPGSILPAKQSVSAEMSLSLDQIHQASDEVMTIHQQCAVPDIKHVLESSVSACTIALEEEISTLKSPTNTENLRKSGRKAKKCIRLVEQNEKEKELVKPGEDGKDILNFVATPAGHCKRRNQESSILRKRKESDSTTMSQDNFISDDEEDMFEKLSLDTYYQIIYLFKSEGNYPANSSPAFKRNVRRVAETFVLENELLMYKGKAENSCLRKTIMTTEERLAKMSEGHIKNGEHLSRFKVYDCLNTDKLYWKGMHMDIKAFVTACPGCRFGESKRKRKVPAKYLRWFKATASDNEEEDSDIESNTGNMSYNDLWLFIKKGVTPDTLSRSELLMFRKKAKKFKIDKGILYYFPPSDGKSKARKVLRTDKEKQEIIKKTHLGAGGEHLNQGAMKHLLRKSVFWYGMPSDVEKFVAMCPQCRPTVPPVASEEKDKQETALEEKVKLFQDYFAGKDIVPKQESLDSLFPSREDDLVAAAVETADVTDAKSVNEQSIGLKVESDPKEPPESAADDLVEDKTEEFEENMTEQNINEDCSEGEVEDTTKDETTAKTESQFTVSLKKLVASPQLRKPRIRKRCDVCLQVILGENNFKAHMYKHTGVKPFDCSQCHKKFTNVKGLRLHSRKHTGHRPFLCNICGRGFPRSASLRYHIKTHERGNNLPITCDICQRTFTTMNRLIKHKGYKHPAQAPVYSCDQCGKCFTAKRSLKRHEEAHQGIRKYMCQYCKRRFFRKEYLNYHLISHANEDPSLLANHKFRNKAKRPLPSCTKKKNFSEGIFTIALDNPSAADLAQNQETYGQVVEIPEGWPQLPRERALVYELGPDGTLVPTDPSQVGRATTTMVVMEAPSVGTTLSDSGMEVHHIFLPSQEDASHGQQQAHQMGVPSEQEEHVQQHHAEQIEQEQQQQQQLPNPDSQSESELIASMKPQQQYISDPQQPQHQDQTNVSPTIIKLTQEDFVALQHQQPHSSQEHYQHYHQHTHSGHDSSTEGHEVSTSSQDTKSIEISLPSGSTHTLTLPASVVEGGVMEGTGDAGEDTTAVQYQVECLPGETLTEADFDAIRMLTQARLAGPPHQLSQH